MLKSYIIAFFLFGILTSVKGSRQVVVTESLELTVPNFDAESAACVVMVPQDGSQCTPTGCDIPLLKGAIHKLIKLNFSCLPMSAPTGFENPAPEVEVQSLHAKNAVGHLSLVDDAETESGQAMRELNFCLYGKSNIFCGNAKVLRLKGRAKADDVTAIKRFLQRVELLNGSSK